MNPLVRKEIRLILPFFGIAMFLAILPSLFVSGMIVSSGMALWTFGFGIVLLGMAPFGQEFGLGTFSSLLAQPIERRRLWRTKTLLVLIAVLLALAAFIVTVHIRLDLSLKETMQKVMTEFHEGTLGAGAINSRLADIGHAQEKWYAQEFQQSCQTAVLLALVAITGALWTSLLFRQIGAALWFAILVPGAIFVVVEIFLHNFSGQTQETTLAVLLILYSAGGLVWARRMFFHAQDSQWLGETISLLSLSPAKTQVDSSAARGRKPLAALFRKEFQSHQISLLIAFGLLMLHGATLVFRKFYPLPRTSELRFAVEAVPLLWLLVPWLIGCVTVAEERKLGTMQSQLCLPVTRRAQFTAKCVVALLLGIVLGALMPCLIETLGTLAGITSEIVKPTFLPETGVFFATIGEMVIAAGAIATISLFASTLSRDTLHALGAAVVFAGAFVALFGWLQVETRSYDYSLWKGPLIFIIGVPVSIVAVLWLSFSNYKLLQIGRNVWLRNVLILSASLFFAGIAAAVLYQRPWELVMATEPHHGPARLSGSIQPVIRMPAGRVIALLPDGRLWVTADYRWKQPGQYGQVWDSKNRKNRWREITVPIPTGGMFVGGSNWVALAANDHYDEAAALQSDGTLWNILSRNGKTDSWNPEFWFGLEPKPRQIGSANDWKAVAAGPGYFLAVKTDGTLWSWGRNNEGQFGTFSGSYIAEPVRIGTNSDWEALFADEYRPFIMKSNGDIWIWTKVEGEAVLKLVSVKLNGADWLSVDRGNDGYLVVRRDGTLWLWNNRPTRVFGLKNSAREMPGLVRLGHDSDWVQVSGYSFDLAAIKGGRLLKNGTALFAQTLGEPSSYSDWLATDGNWDQLSAMGADGTVCLWSATPGSSTGNLFGPSHRPLWSLNILSNSD